MLFISFTYLIAIARITTLIEVVRIDIFVLFFILWESAHYFPIKYDISYWFFIGSLCQMKEVLFCPSWLRILVMSGCYIVSNAYSTSLEIIIWILIFSVNMVSYIYRFSNFKPTLHTLITLLTNDVLFLCIAESSLTFF